MKAADFKVVAKAPKTLPCSQGEICKAFKIRDMDNTKTILFVEDDAVIMTVYRKPLELTGFTVIPAYDGVQAMRYLNQCKPDLIVLDLVLPALDGEEVLKLIYASPTLRHIPVIVLSTNSVISLANEPTLQKAERHLLKGTCTFPILHATIKEVLAEAEAAKSFQPHASAAPAAQILKRLQLNQKENDPANKPPLNQ